MACGGRDLGVVARMVAVGSRMRMMLMVLVVCGGRGGG